MNTLIKMAASLIDINMEHKHKAVKLVDFHLSEALFKK